MDPKCRIARAALVGLALGEALSSPPDCGLALIRTARSRPGSRVRRTARPADAYCSSPSPAAWAGLPERIHALAGLDFALVGEVQLESPQPSVEAVRELALAADVELLLGVGGDR
jgi:hypothetical protein